MRGPGGGTRGRRLLLVLVAILACVLPAEAAFGAATIETREIRLRLNADFQPLYLPKKSFAPVQFEGNIDVARPGGGAPPALTR